jgi:lipoprotein-releasing system permease protein
MRALRVMIMIALAHLRVRVRPTIVAVAGGAVGVAIFLTVSGVMMGTQNDMVRSMVNSAPHIIVMDEQRDGGLQPVTAAFPQGAVEVRGVRPQTEVRGLKDWPAMLADARAVPGAVASPSLSGAISIRFAGRTEPVSLSGIDPRVEGKLMDIEETLSGGQLLDLERRPDGIIVSRPLAEKLGADIGDTLVVTSTAGVLQRMRIIALVNADALQGFYAGDGAAYGLLRTAQVLFARPNVVNQIHIKIGNPYDAQTLAETLESRWGYKWQSWQERSADLLGLLVPRTIISYVVTSAVLLVASFGIYTAISTSVNDKRRDIAILRAMGFQQRDIRTIFLVEGMIVGAIGAAIGMTVAALLLNWIAGAELQLRGQAFSFPVERGMGQFVLAAFVSIGSALIAAWMPSSRAAKVDPVDILRGAA